MFSAKYKFFVCVILLFTATNHFAQDSAYEIELQLDEILLKKDLLQVIEEAENAPKNDIVSLHRRLILYRRAVNFEKASQIISQIFQFEKQNGKNFNGGYTITHTLGDELFKDTETIKVYLQNYYLEEGLFKKYIKLCQQDKTACDVNGFDNWLGQKFLENQKDDYEYERWLGNRLRWREEFGLNKDKLMEKLVEDFRNNPNNQRYALRYLRHFPKASTVEEIAEKFNSKQAFDYYAVATAMIPKGQLYMLSDDERKMMMRHGIAFLHKSLEIPFNDQDIVLMYKDRIPAASYDPRKINYKKQFQYWVKTALAETYKNIGQADKAQPIAEELVKMDKSDIQTGDTEYLGGAVQAASGERVIEKKILSEQEKRENTSEYWIERANYYRGRKELKLVFDAYLEGIETVSFDANDEQSRRNRSSLIWSLARFASDFDENAEDLKEGDDLSDEQMLKAKIWLETEKFLEDEFERHKTNTAFAYSLLDHIEGQDFDELFAKLVDRETEIIVKIFRDASSNNYSYGNLINDIWESNGISQTKKDELFAQLFNIAQTADVEKSMDLVGSINYHTNKYVVQFIPVLNRNLAKVEEDLKAKNLSFLESEDLEDLKNDHLKLIFSNYLLAKNWRAAEKFMSEKFDWSESFSYDKHDSLKRIALVAAENGDIKDAVRLWKMRANLSRRNLDGLETLSQNYDVRTELIIFYEQMRTTEPYSPMPEKALKILR